MRYCGNAVIRFQNMTPTGYIVKIAPPPPSDESLRVLRYSLPPKKNTTPSTQQYTRSVDVTGRTINVSYQG